MTQELNLNTIKGLKQHFLNGNTIENESADFQFVMRDNKTMFQFSNGEYKFYNTLNGLCKAALYRIKRG